jgi:hypothetical protein
VTAGKRQLPPPAGGDDLAGILAARLSRAGSPGQAPPPADPDPDPAGSPVIPEDVPAAASPPPRRAGTTRPAAPARPSARDLAAPARQAVAREALKVAVPAERALVRRLHARRLDTGQDIRDQVAIALDEALTREGY